jgi:hypothetical protein
MDCERRLAKSRYSTTLFCIVVVMLSIGLAGCREITEPPPSTPLNGASGSLSEAQNIYGLSVETGPIITVTNEYLDPVVSTKPGGWMRIPEGVPLTFCWTAKRASDGGAIEAYRYGWDVFDIENPDAWDVDFTPYDGSEVCSPPQTFNARGFHMFVLEVIDDAGASSLVIIAMDIILGPSSFDVMPGTCKNPLSMQRKGPIRTVIPGRIGLAISEIDVAGLHLWIDGNVVEPMKIQVRDITSPMINRDPCDCIPTNTDGIEDLLITFAATDIIRALGPVEKGETRDISIHGTLLDGYDFTLRDCVVIVGNPRTGDDPALFNRDAVLAAMQKGYNEKDFRKVSALFDDDFTFYFSEEDYLSGDIPYQHWGREEELAATANLFNVDNPAGALIAGSVRDRLKHSGASEGATWGRIKAAFFDGIVNAQTSISLLLIYHPGEENWIAIQPPDPDQYPGEVWYEKTANYFMTVQAGDFTFITDFPLQTSFIVRFSETKGHWQLVRWRDGL